MAFIHFRDTTVHYTISGTGPAVVWLHGFLENRSIWKELTSSFDTKQTNICIDLLGHGATGMVGNVHSMELQAMAVKSVLTFLKVQNCTLIGHSMGGYVALAFAEVDAEKLQNLILLNTTSHADSPEKISLRKRALQIIDAQKDTYVRMGILNLFTPQSRQKHKSQIAALIATAQKTNLKGIAAALKGMMLRKDRQRVLEGFNGGKCIIAGNKDPVISSAFSKEEAQLTNTPIFIVEGGHMSFLEARDQIEKLLNQIIHGF